ncbi:HdeD family acid-resistance protein [Methanomassiliicoccus luminyensis]|jgi:uncharacterized membrane protein HdeD (DUF308 family)|uniref:HdeD family acid-resistance protein n=1 Tax=Methanomassiliicoccus luminyensis TaxID=1080712 RepID=UPI0009DB274A|nr:DUF308 domain-containing protein [Methanomassiliicoccus luminyensis]
MSSEGFTSRWWGRVIFGVIAILFGLAIVVFPGLSLTVFLWIFGFFMLISGLVLVSYGLKREKGMHRTLNLVEGVLGIVIAAIAFLAPGLTAVTAVYLVAFFAVVSGLLQLGEAFTIPMGTTMLGTSSRWFLAGSGVLSIVLGALLFLSPGSGILAFLWLVAAFIILVGILNIATGIRLKRSIGATTVTRPR